MDTWNASALIGTRLGTSILERPLGIGGMGAVYLARQERPRRHVAVKVLRPGIAADDNAWRVFLARFRREADAAAALDHANIVPIYEFGEEDSLAYIVMPYLSDGSLANFLTPDTLLPVDDVVSYIDQAAAALDYAHQHGIVHRDVKPSNLLLHPDGRLLLADFGIARPLNMKELPISESPFEGGDLTVTGAAMGTPEYMAPEQVRGDPVSAATDTYALGVVAYALLTGHTPFESMDVTSVMARQLSEMPPPLRSMRRGVPRDVEEAINWALAKDPSHRPGSTGSFARAFRAASTGVPVASGSQTLERSRPQTLLAASSPRSRSNGAPPVLTPSTDAGLPPLPPDGPDSPTIYDGMYRGGRGGFGAPAWPAAPSTGGEYPAPATLQPRTLGLLALLGATGVLILTLAVVLASGSLQGLLTSLNTNTGPNGVGLHSTATSEPTATVLPSPTPVINWLRVAPTSVDLTCKNNKRNAPVTLTNLGQDTVDWNADKEGSAFSISVSPDNGQLGAQQSGRITISYNPFLGPGGYSGNITFASADDNSQAGQPAVLHVNAHACFGGSSQASLSPQTGKGPGHGRKHEG
jgi:serine/threonine protein kinase